MIGGAVLLPGRGFETKNLKSYTTFIVVVNVILNPIAASVAATAALD